MIVLIRLMLAVCASVDAWRWCGWWLTAASLSSPAPGLLSGRQSSSVSRRSTGAPVFALANRHPAILSSRVPVCPSSNGHHSLRGAGPGVSAAAQPWEARAAHAGPQPRSQINTAHTW